MMGSTKLAEIKEFLRQALRDEVGNPREWLEERIRELKKDKRSQPASVEVYESLMRLFEKPKAKKGRKRKVSQVPS